MVGLVRIDEHLYSALVSAAEKDKRNIRVCVMMAVEDWLKKYHPDLLK